MCRSSCMAIAVHPNMAVTLELWLLFTNNESSAWSLLLHARPYFSKTRNIKEKKNKTLICSYEMCSKDKHGNNLRRMKRRDGSVYSRVTLSFPDLKLHPWVSLSNILERTTAIYRSRGHRELKYYSLLMIIPNFNLLPSTIVHMWQLVLQMWKYPKLNLNNEQIKVMTFKLQMTSEMYNWQI